MAPFFALAQCAYPMLTEGLRLHPHLRYARNHVSAAIL